MKITLFIGSLTGGGAERVLCNLANYLSDKGYEIEIITMSDDDPSYKLRQQVRVTPLLGRSEKRNLFSRSILRITRLRKYMISSHTDEYVVMLPWTMVILLSQHNLTKAPIVISERCDPYRRSAKWKMLMRYYVRYASGGVFQTEMAKRWYVSNSLGLKSVIIPNAINEDFLFEQDTAVKKEKTIIGVGRLAKQKNFRLLIDAFTVVHKHYPDYRLVIYGEGPLRKDLEEYIREVRLDSCVELAGYISDVVEKMKVASMFVLSSDYEGMPNSLIEAMSLGVPCVATNCPVGGPEYLINNEENGLLVQPGNAEELSMAMLRILDDPQFSRKIGLKASQIRYDLSPENIYGKWEAFLMSVAKKRIGDEE